MPSPFRSRPPQAGATGFRDRLRPRHDDSGVPPYTFAFGVLLVLLVAALSFWQATAPDPARRVIEAGIVSLTDIDTVLAEHQSELQALASASTDRSFAIPGYPLDVYLSRDEVLTLTTPALRALILQRSSALVYTRGLSAFDRTGGQSLSIFSSEGALQLLVGQLSADSHDHAGVAATVLAVLTALSGIALVFKAEGMRRVRALGEAAVPAGLLGILATIGGRALLGLFGGSDRFDNDIRSVVTSVMDVPLRNYTVLAVAGAILLAAGLALRLLERLLAPADFARQPAYEPAFDDDDDDLS